MALGTQWKHMIALNTALHKFLPNCQESKR
jgi:hypothetical protein